MLVHVSSLLAQIRTLEMCTPDLQVTSQACVGFGTSSRCNRPEQMPAPFHRSALPSGPGQPSLFYSMGRAILCQKAGDILRKASQTLPFTVRREGRSYSFNDTCTKALVDTNKKSRTLRRCNSLRLLTWVLFSPQPPISLRLSSVQRPLAFSMICNVNYIIVLSHILTSNEMIDYRIGAVYRWGSITI